jgi:hypothetical protein
MPCVQSPEAKARRRRRNRERWRAKRRQKRRQARLGVIAARLAEMQVRLDALTRRCGGLSGPFDPRGAGHPEGLATADALAAAAAAVDLVNMKPWDLDHCLPDLPDFRGYG